MDRLRNGLDRLLEVTFGWIPQLVGALLILFIGHLVAKAVSKLLYAFLTNVKLNQRLHAGHGGNVIQRAIPDPAELLKTIAYWLIFIGAVSLGATVLGIDALNRLIYGIYGYVPQVIAACIIFMVGSAVAVAVGALVKNVMGDTATGKIVESVAPTIVLGITIFMILDQLGVAPTIVTITYGALLGSVALGSALAFGLGGRDVAARLLEGAYEKGQTGAAQARADVALGRDRASQQVEKLRNKNR